MNGIDAAAAAHGRTAAAAQGGDPDSEADGLFRRHPVYEIRAVEKRTR